MSVIFGIDEKDKLVICGDKRGSSELDSILSDELQKVSVINTHLAFASAGNFAIEKAYCWTLKNRMK